jgi:hypothetical protein
LRLEKKGKNMSTFPTDKPETDIAAPTLNLGENTKPVEAEARSGNPGAASSASEAASEPQTSSATGKKSGPEASGGTGTKEQSTDSSKSELSAAEIAELRILRDDLLREWKPKGTLEEEEIDKIVNCVFLSRRTVDHVRLSDYEDRIRESLRMIEDLRTIRRRMGRSSALAKRSLFRSVPASRKRSST